MLGTVASSGLLLDAVPAFAATDEIIVTARRREESLQDVPISAFSADEKFIEKFAIEDARGLLAQIPGVKLGSGTVGAVVADDVVVRGVGVARIESSGSPTGIFRNGLFIGNGTYFGRTFTNFDMFDIKTFELYKGPQVALWGRQAAGGAINIVSAQPEFDRIGGRAKVSYEVYARAKKAEGVLNVPITDEFAVRLAGLVNDADGFVKVEDPNSPVDGERLDKVFWGGIRGSARWKTTDWLEQSFSIEYYRAENPSYSVFFHRPGRGDQGKFSRSCAADQPSPPYYPGQRCQFTEDENPSEIDTTNAFYKALIKVPDYGTLDLSAIYTVRNTTVLDEYDTYVFGLLPPTVGLSGAGGLLFGGALTGFGAQAGTDATYPRTGSFEKWGVQAIFTSEQMGPVNWLIGADFYEVQDAFSENTVVPFYSPYDVAAGAVPAHGLILNQKTKNIQTRNPDSWSVFGSIGYDVLDALEIEVGARYTDNHTPTFAYNSTVLACPDSGPQPSPCSALSPGFGLSVAVFELDRDIDENVFTPEVSLRYKFEDGNSAYFRYAQGFRPAGFDARVNMGVFLGPYSTERVHGYEVGYKGAAFDRLISFDVATYYYIHENFQIQDLFVGEDGFFRNRIANAPYAYDYGAEASVRSRFALGPGTLDTSLGVAWSNGYIGAYRVGPTMTLSANSDKRTPDTRDYQVVLNLGYLAPVPNWSEASWFGNVSLRAEGGGYQNAANTQELKSTETVDATLGLNIGTWR
ncbi:MAG: TonB-dependent receptor, partial [Alphaproteobacteria bacterium]|nr:TonB-dependent receptor [Alphaproteobacteria bacterium]